MKRIGIGLVVGALCLVAQAPAQADPLEVTLAIPTLEVGRYNAIATWNPENQTACLYDESHVTAPSSPALPWATEGDCTTWEPTDVVSGIYDVTWGTSRALLVASAAPSLSPAPTIVVVPDYTWVAYDTSGTGNFYTKDAQRSTDTLSLLRPLAFALPEVTGQTRERLIRYPSVNPINFLRDHGHTIDVIAQSHLDSYNYNLSSYQTIVLYGHDEYWTPSLKSNLENAVKAGSDLLNLSGNTGYRRILRDGMTIRHELPNRWGSRTDEKTSQEILCARFLGYPFNRVHNTSKMLSKSEFRSLRKDGFPTSIARKKVYRALRGIRVRDTSSGLFAGTTLQKGSWFGGASEVMFIEVDGVPLTAAGTPESAFMQHMGESQLTSISGESWMQKRRPKKYHTRAGLLIFGKSGLGTVFTAGPVGWIGSIQAGDVNVQQITLNALTILQTPAAP